jgi:methylenetetrahydrofolate dehydrogenase (NADP+)/methenyltetrahydrofolate cyclohydrolase
LVQIIGYQSILPHIEHKIECLVESLKLHNITPHLRVIQVGDFAPSQIYVKKKGDFCCKMGLKFTLDHLPTQISQEKMLTHVDQLNNDNAIHGVIIQLPLPPHIDPDVLQRIDSSKDVDCAVYENLAKLLIGKPFVIPPTPHACYEFIKYVESDLSKLHVVIVGRSNLVGKPLFALLINHNATVTLAHSKTKNLKEITKSADVLVVAIGKANFITDDFIKEGAIVIDVGINRIINDTGHSKIVGDVDFDNVAQKTRAITPVPGGIGPITVASLIQNVCLLAQLKIDHKLKKKFDSII